MLEYIQALDGAVLLWIQEVLRLPVLDGFMTLFTQLGNAGLVWVGISLALLLVPRTRRMGFWALVALLLVCCARTWSSSTWWAGPGPGWWWRGSPIWW